MRRRTLLFLGILMTTTLLPGVGAHADTTTRDPLGDTCYPTRNAPMETPAGTVYWGGAIGTECLILRAYVITGEDCLRRYLELEAGPVHFVSPDSCTYEATVTVLA